MNIISIIIFVLAILNVKLSKYLCKKIKNYLSQV